LGVETLKNTNNASVSEPRALYAVENAMMGVLEKALNPLVRLCLRNGVTYNAATSLLKQIFIHSALNEEVGDNPRSTANISRVALRTAINRAEVKQVVERKRVQRIRPEQWLIEANVLDHWINDDKFSDGNGTPRPLPLTGRGASFQTLCQRCGTNISYGVIAKSLEKAGNIEIRGMDRIVNLIKPDYVPDCSTDVEMLSVIESSVEKYLQTIEHNVTRKEGEAPLLQRLIVSMDIPKADRERVQDVVNEMATRQKSEARRTIGDLEDESLPDDEKFTVGVGYFYFQN